MGFQTLANKEKGKLLPKSMRKTDADDERVDKENESLYANQYPNERDDYKWAAARGRGIGTASRAAQDRYMMEKDEQQEKERELRSSGRFRLFGRGDSSDERDPNYLGESITNKRGVISASNLRNKEFREAYKRDMYKRIF